MMRCMLLCMLEAAERGLYLLDVLDVLDVLEVMRRMLCALEMLEGTRCVPLCRGRGG